jgi:hypothetical protein|tara:strand:- start:25 stop:351 length:327 start_codon:yes stop_codon:yes gene_type:complete
VSEKPKTYRSYGVAKIDDNLSFNINIHYIFRLALAISFLVMGYIRIENRLAELERGMESADTRITELIDKHMIEEQKERDAMEERISFFEQELNLNPFSWKKSRRKKK